MMNAVGGSRTLPSWGHGGVGNTWRVLPALRPKRARAMSGLRPRRQAQSPQCTDKNTEAREDPALVSCGFGTPCGCPSACLSGPPPLWLPWSCRLQRLLGPSQPCSPPGSSSMTQPYTCPTSVRWRPRICSEVGRPWTGLPPL